MYWPVGPKGPNDTGLSRKHIMEGINGSLRRLDMDYVDLYQAHRYDHETPLEETIQAFADVVRAGKALYIGVSEWNAEQLRAGQALAREAGFRLVSNQPQYSALWRVIEAEVMPASLELGMSQVVWSPMAQGVLSGKYLPGQPAPAGSRATDEKGGIEHHLPVHGRHGAERVQKLRPIAAELGLDMSQLAIAWVLQNPNVASALVGASRPEQVAENVKASGRGDPAGNDGRHRRGAGGLGRAGPGQDRQPGAAPGLSPRPRARPRTLNARGGAETVPRRDGSDAARVSAAKPPAEARSTWPGRCTRPGPPPVVLLGGARAVLRRHPGDDRIRRGVLDHHGVGADGRIRPDHDRAQHLGTGADDHAVPDGRVALDLGQRTPAQGDPVVDHHVVADLRGLPDDHAHAVVDEEAPADGGPGVDLDPGQEAPGLGEQARREARLGVLPQPWVSRWIQIACRPEYARKFSALPRAAGSCALAPRRSSASREKNLKPWPLFVRRSGRRAPDHRG